MNCNSNTHSKKQNYIMAEILETNDGMHSVVSHNTIPSNAKTNAALTLGIIGTAIGGLGLLTGGRNFLNNNCGMNYDNGRYNDARCGERCATFGAYAVPTMFNTYPNIVQDTENAYLERTMAQQKLDGQKQFYEGYIANMAKIHQDFDEAKQRDIDNSFQLYKYTRDNDDKLALAIANVHNESERRNEALKDCLKDKINHLENRIDVMSAVRPYQDALINERIDKNALIADFNLHRRTARMISGKLVLPSDPTVTGYESYTPFN